MQPHMQPQAHPRRFITSIRPMGRVEANRQASKLHSRESQVGLPTVDPRLLGARTDLLPKHQDSVKASRARRWLTTRAPARVQRPGLEPANLYPTPGSVLM